MDPALVTALLDRCQVVHRPVPHGDEPTHWQELFADRVTPAERVSRVRSWWTSALLVRLPGLAARVESQLVDVVLTGGAGYPALTYVFDPGDGRPEGLSGGVPRSHTPGGAAMAAAVPPPLREFFDDLHGWFGSVGWGGHMGWPTEDATFAATVHWDDVQCADPEWAYWLSDEPADRPVPRPDELVELLHSGYGDVVMLSRDLPEGRAFEWYAGHIEDLDLWAILDERLDRAVSVLPEPTPTDTLAQLRARLDALPEIRRVELQPPPDGA